MWGLWFPGGVWGLSSRGAARTAPHGVSQPSVGSLLRSLCPHPHPTGVSPSPRVFWGSLPVSPRPKPVPAQPPVPNAASGLETPRKGNRNLPRSSCLLPAQTQQLFWSETRHLVTNAALPTVTLVTSCGQRSSRAAHGGWGGTGAQTPLPASQSRGVAAGSAGLERPHADHGQGQHGLHQAGGQELG